MSTFHGPALTLLSFADSILSLAVLELYLRTRTPGGALNRLAVATLLCALTVAMGIGIVSATISMWLPIVRTVRLFLSF